MSEIVSETDSVKIEFPCDYAIKVLGRDDPGFEEAVFEVFELHASGFARERIRRRASREGTFSSITIYITATGEAQLEALHQSLLATGRVQMVI